MTNVLNNFKKNGVIYLKNFFTDQEINLISERVKEVFSEEYEFIYLINNKKINQSFLSKSKFTSVKDDIQATCNGKELKIKTLDEFIDFFQPIMKKNNLKEYFFEEFNRIFIEKFQYELDVLYDAKCSSVFLTNKVLDLYREILQSNELVYYAETDVSYNKPAVYGWHSDDEINTRENTNEKTFHVRGAIYFHSHEGNSGGIKFMPGSHYFIRPNKLLKKFIKKILFKKKFNNLISNTRLLFSKNYFPGSKDFTVWDKRILHSPWAAKVKGFPKLSLHPSIEKKLPRFIVEKNSFPRSLINLDMGIKSKSLDDYIEHLSQREEYKFRWQSQSKLLSSDFSAKLANKNIIFNDYCLKKWA